MKLKDLRRLAAEMELQIDLLPPHLVQIELSRLVTELRKALAPKTKPARLSDAEFMLELKQNYPGLDLTLEFKKMDGWLLTHPGRQKTREFIVKWLNKEIHKTVVGNGTPKPPPPPDHKDPIGRSLWRRTHGDPKQYGYD